VPQRPGCDRCPVPARPHPSYRLGRHDDPAWNATVVRQVDPDEVRALKDQPGGDLCLGGADLAASFLAHDLIDEWRLYVVPVVLGAGRRLFPDGVRNPLRLVETRAFDNGVLLTRYARA
jgi:dihydrofolate reductase